MRAILSLLLLFISFFVSAQVSQQDAVKLAIETFFEGFHEGDTTKMRSVMMDKVVMQTAFRNKEGKDVLRDDGGPENLLNAIATRPDDQKWDERLLDFSIQVDGNMANAWVAYEFWYNDTFSHCGVNSFQLFNDQGTWKIIYLIDTRRRQGCESFKG